jgi:hypothetical protein
MTSTGVTNPGCLDRVEFGFEPCDRGVTLSLATGLSA